MLNDSNLGDSEKALLSQIRTSLDGATVAATLWVDDESRPSCVGPTAKAHKHEQDRFLRLDFYPY